MNIKNLSVALVTLIASSAAQAQEPMQWRVEDGGSGHWYEIQALPDRSWNSASLSAQSQGGHLATATTSAENGLVCNMAVAQMAFAGPDGPYLGGYKNSSNSMEWVTGEPVDFVAWASGEPNGGAAEPALHLKLYGSAPAWNDCPAQYAHNFVIEWSADCNNDGIVDKGQILRGQLPDIDNNGIPDPCEQPTCRNADLLADRNINGADLGILLAQWGPNTQYTISDINNDGVVDGSDLGLLLSFWGPCPY